MKANYRLYICEFLQLLSINAQCVDVCVNHSFVYLQQCVCDLIGIINDITAIWKMMCEAYIIYNNNDMWLHAQLWQHNI